MENQYDEMENPKDVELTVLMSKLPDIPKLIQAHILEELCAASPRITKIFFFEETWNKCFVNVALDIHDEKITLNSSYGKERLKILLDSFDFEKKQKIL